MSRPYRRLHQRSLRSLSCGRCWYQRLRVKDVLSSKMVRTIKQGTDTCTQRARFTSALSTSRLCCRFCLWKHTQCTEQSTRRWIVCASPGVLPCSTGWQPLRVKPLDHHRFPQICLKTSCFAWGTALRGIRRILDLLVMALQALSSPLCAPVEALNLGHQRNTTLANGGKQP